MAPSLWTAGPQTPVEAPGGLDGIGQDLISVPGAAVGGGGFGSAEEVVGAPGVELILKRMNRASWLKVVFVM